MDRSASASGESLLGNVLLVPAAMALLLSACASGSALSVTPVAEPVEAIPGFFSAEQAQRGRESYREACGECHTLSEFRGTDFEWTWRRQTAWNLFSEVSSTMPEDKPGQLSPETYADIVAYLLNLNDYQVGSVELSPSQEALSAIPLGAGARKTKSKE